MAKLLNKLSKNQRNVLIFSVLIIVISVAFGVFIRCSYNRISLDESAYSNAEFSMNKDDAEYIDYKLENLEFDAVKMILDDYDFILRIECLQTEHCYNCTKYICKLIDTVKGNENGEKIVLYQWNSFTAADGKLLYEPIDNMLSLKNGKEYLIFARKRDYCQEYQKTLDYNEYSLGLNEVPTAFILNEEQTSFVDINKDKVYSSLHDKYYLCFSESALKNINDISKHVINHYIS